MKPLELVRRAAAEPLLHFLVIGALIFAADHFIDRDRDDSQTIVVSEAVRKEAREVFAAGMKREPSPADLKILLDRWVDNEVLYREGLALGLDRGDSSIRERVIFKALSITRTGLSLPKIDEAALRAWFDARRDRYQSPARFDFLEAVVTGDASPAALTAFAAALNGKGESSTESSLRVFKDRPRPNLVESYGAEFTDAIEKLEPGRWQTLPSKEGLRLIRLESIKPGTAVSFEDTKDALYQDWKDDTMAELTTKAVREMGRKYRVRLDEAAR